MERPPTLDHLERLLSDAYRKEIDQEENVWRSLPFFAATLALQMAALFQIVERLPPRGTPVWWAALLCGGLTGLSTVTAVAFLAGSIFPARFRYLVGEAELVRYAETLNETERLAPETMDALVTLKTTLVRQYAAAIENNRGINQRRSLWRSVAGMAMLTSVLSTIGLVITVAVTYIPRGQ